MACEAFYTVNAGNVSSLPSTNLPPASIGMNSIDYIADIFNQAVIGGAISCADLPAQIGPFASNIVPEGTVVLPATAANFSIAGANGAGNILIQSSGGAISGRFMIQFVGGVPTFTNTSNWTGPLVIQNSGLQAIGMGWEPGSISGDVITFNFAYANIASFNTVEDWINCAISACSIAPTALPSSPGAIKSANFTRIFNPLNLPLRSK